MTNLCVDDRTVAMVLLDRAAIGYPPGDEAFGPDCCFPEFVGHVRLSGTNHVYRAVRSLFREAGLDGSRYGTRHWNPLGDVIRPGDKVALKPNWVSHPTTGTPPECLVTHASLIRPVLDYVLLAKPGRIVIGDAPVQGCNLEWLLRSSGWDLVQQHFTGRSPRLEWRDFRRTVLDGPIHRRSRTTDILPLEQYVTCDVGAQSFLEPVTDGRDRFRVTVYDPDRMSHWHRKGMHRYLVARDILEADVVIGLPKLKTHAKAGITGALKNTVGINGNKEYLPHHRAGGPGRGGDCYPEDSVVKSLAERLLDASNRRSGLAAAAFYWASRVAVRASALGGNTLNLEGSWYGNDTAWRMCLDLNRVLQFGRLDGMLGDVPQRRLLFITDAIVAGEGNGPLHCRPRSLGALTLGRNAAAVDYVHAHLMGFDWERVPLIRESFGPGRPIARCQPRDVEVLVAGQRLQQPWPTWCEGVFEAAPGWRGHCERWAEREA
jgi:uncharacterized protein (DUF362 family)